MRLTGLSNAGSDCLMQNTGCLPQQRRSRKISSFACRFSIDRQKQKLCTSLSSGQRTGCLRLFPSNGFQFRVRVLSEKVNRSLIYFTDQHKVFFVSDFFHRQIFQIDHTGFEVPSEQSLLQPWHEHLALMEKRWATKIILRANGLAINRECCNLWASLHYLDEVSVLHCVAFHFVRVQKIGRKDFHLLEVDVPITV